jgi:hypothetical protein
VIDEARGLFLVWMICSHSLTLAALPATHALQNLRPRGWATMGFVMLSGFAVGIIYAHRRGRPETTTKLYRRSLTIALVAVGSNVAFQMARALVEGTWTPQAALAIVTLQRSWSISSALLSTAAVLAVSPLLLRTATRIGAPSLFALVTALAFALDGLIHYAPADWRDTQWFMSLLAPRGTMESAYLPFPVLLQFTMAVWGFAFGALIAPAPNARTLLGAGALGAIVLVAAQAGYSTPALLYESRLLLVIGAFALASFVPALTPFRSLCALLGRSGLLIFIVHRIILQAGARTLTGLPRQTLAVALIATALLICGGLAYAREHVRRTRDRRLVEIEP